ncbi:hypothetical protein HYH03_002985 [Edaphochlamys debaryana]|uniref:Uncharacterized protein n=1 Tax=Edaphochlamys debaryana TaxID=47281 RepID=A0A835YB66_9CHLO|nr:hypothetical protein HYH03_002985 [Edaphochlamys debaryana]|eukprot:KAG2499411.1 hypothetical protein HYH03_002985 [Edaphochlamys debaryana]
MPGPYRKRPAAELGEEAGGLRPKKLAGFWSPFNTWWRAQYERIGKRPCKAQICEWHEAHALAAWGQECPSLDDMLIHAKGMRSTEEVRNYFRVYRQQLRNPRQPTSRKGAARSTREPCASSGSDAEAETLAWCASDPQPATSGHASCSQGEPSLPARPATSAGAQANTAAASSQNLLPEALSHTPASGGGSCGGSAPYQPPAVTTSMGGGGDRSGPHWTWGWGPVPANWGPVSFGYPTLGVSDGGAPMCPYQHPGGLSSQAVAAGGGGGARVTCQPQPTAYCGAPCSHHPDQQCGPLPCSFAVFPMSSGCLPLCGPSSPCASAQPMPCSTGQPPRFSAAAAASAACTEAAAGPLYAYQAKGEPCEAANAAGVYEALLRELDSGAADAAVMLELQPLAWAAAKPQVTPMQPAAVLTSAPLMPHSSSCSELPGASALKQPQPPSQSLWSAAAAAGAKQWKTDPGVAWSHWPYGQQPQAWPQQGYPDGVVDAIPWAHVEQGGQEEGTVAGALPDLADLLQADASDEGEMGGCNEDAEWWALLEQLRA